MKLFILLGKDAVAGRFLVNPPDELPIEVRQLNDEDSDLTSPWIGVTPDELSQRQAATATAATAWRQELDAALQAANVTTAATEQITLRDAARRQQYVLRSDPLCFKYLRGEATLEEWKAEVATIQTEIQ
jgi:hypothetical protein